MPRVAFPAGFLGVENLPRTRRSLQNCFNNLDGKIIAVPGITQLNTTGKVARGQFVWNGSLYQVVSQSLIKITNTLTGAFSTIGTISGAVAGLRFGPWGILVGAILGSITGSLASCVRVRIGIADNKKNLVLEFDPD